MTTFVHAQLTISELTYITLHGIEPARLPDERVGEIVGCCVGQSANKLES